METYKPNDFAEKRVNQAQDCRLWTPKDALLACLRDIESGKINPDKLCIHYTCLIDDNKNRTFGCYVAGMTYLEHAGLLAEALKAL